MSCDKKKDDKLISVILPVFNGEKYISQAIESVLNQTYKKLELVLIDDCSTDGTFSILKKYERLDERVRVIKNTVNLKLPATLNVGFKNSVGSYLTWTSADNIYLPDALERMYIEMEKHDNCVLVYCDTENIDSSGAVVGHNYREEPDNLPFGTTIGACFMYRRSAYDKVGDYNTDFFLAEDYEYWIRISKLGLLVHVPEVHYYYRVHSESLTSTRSEAIIRQTAKVQELHLEYLFSMLKCSPRKKDFLYQYMKYPHINFLREFCRCVKLDSCFLFSFHICLCDKIVRMVKSVIRKTSKLLT